MKLQQPTWKPEAKASAPEMAEGGMEGARAPDDISDFLHLIWHPSSRLPNNEMSVC